MKIVSVYQTDIGTRVEFEGDAWTIEDPITCLMDKEGWLFFIATEERGERVAKVAVQVNGLELAPVDLREFPESEYTEISGYTLGLVVMALGGWEKIWTDKNGWSSRMAEGRAVARLAWEDNMMVKATGGELQKFWRWSNSPERMTNATLSLTDMNANDWIEVTS